MYLWLETEEFRFLNPLSPQWFLFFHRNNSITPWGGHRIKELYQFGVLYTFLQIRKVFIWKNNLLELSTILICTYNKNSSLPQRELTLLCNSWNTCSNRKQSRSRTTTASMHGARTVFNWKNAANFFFWSSYFWQ